MATLLDTSAVIVFLRRSRPGRFESVAAAAGDALGSGAGLLSAVSATELLLGARDDGAAADLRALLARVPVVASDREVAELAGRMGAAARRAGAPIPTPDLLIAATAVWLDLPLLTCDSDFGRGVTLGEAGGSPEWGRLKLHPASVVSSQS